ncbi:cytochrome P450 2J4-like [Lytechinus variegatus]|uniref:cytochrome P450 2J4-like n=1 Tax=Lytechinus variegatus TaxID=7654 RepID=UPI001BB1C955|nr:cytochrome P450 2J4-like [Lytechinus variegatus]
MAEFENVVPFVSQSVSFYGLVGVALVLSLFYWVFVQDTKRYPPGPTGLPIFGNVFSLVFTKRQQHEVVNDWTHKYGPIFAFKMLGTRVYVLSDPGLISDAFHHSPDINDRSPMPIAKEIMGRGNTGLVSSIGDVWKEHRRFLMTVFKKIDSGVMRLEEAIGSEVETLLQEIEKKNGDSFDPCNPINIAVANIITRFITGVQYDHGDREFQDLIDRSDRIFKIMGPAGLFSVLPILAKIPSPVKTEITSLSLEILEVIRKSVEAHKSEFDPEEPAKDFISCYLKEIHRRKEENNPGSFDEINLLASCFDALLGGWETSTTSISWITHTLAAHPEAQRQLRQEIYDVVGSDRPPSFSDRHSMPFTEATLAECIRLHPAAAMHVPHTASRDCKIGGYDVIKGSAVTSDLWYLALSRNRWKDPLDFKPDRFLDADGQFNKKLEPLPFGYGRRVCPGEQLARMEIFLLVTNLLQRFSLSLPEGAPTSIGGKHGLTNKPNPFKIHAKKI